MHFKLIHSIVSKARSQASPATNPSLGALTKEEPEEPSDGEGEGAPPVHN